MLKLPTKLAFIDLETTGLSPAHDRIIDIGIVLVEKNSLVKIYQTLINPQRYVSGFIQSYTGIDASELEYAPTFRQVQDQIWSLLEGYCLVAHNARFDYSFLNQEFLRQNMNFSQPYFCTAHLSRRLFPEQRHHNLDAIIDRFSLTCSHRHRALDDAQVIHNFYQHLYDSISHQRLIQTIKHIIRKH